MTALALLDWIEGDLDRPTTAAGASAAAARLGARSRELSLPREPFLRLIEANRQDQERRRATRPGTSSSATATLSANPVGELVLHVFGAATPERIALVGSRLHRRCSSPSTGRTWARTSGAGASTCPRRTWCGSASARATSPRSTPSEPFGELMAFEVSGPAGCSTTGCRSSARSRAARGSPIAAYVGGGRAALDAVERSGFDVLRRTRGPAVERACRDAARPPGGA